MRFVIADDSLIVRDYLRGILVRAGHDVVGAAENGRQALEMCLRLKPDAAVLDVSMPEMQGNEVARRVIEAGVVAHIVIASSNAKHLPVRNMAKALGCGLVGKPFDPKQLRDELTKLIPGFA